VTAAQPETAQAFPALPAPPAGISSLGTSAYLLQNSRLGFPAQVPIWEPAFPFGNQQNPLGLRADVRQTHVRSRCTGKERDAETGLDYFGARYLSSAQGRWTSPDWSAKPEPVPYADLKDPQTLNLYAYVRNNPLTRRDLDGHCDSSAKATANTKCQDPAKLQVNDYGKNHIVKKETGGTSPQQTTYVDGAGHPTVGYGHKVTAADGLKVGGTVTKEKADALRDADMTSAAGAVQKAVGKTQLSQGEFNALVDLVYNAGPGVLTDAKSPSLMKDIGSGDYAAMSGQLQYSKDDKGKQEPGLVTRSNERKEIFTGKEPE
jgi:RHS repeat-associated protein